MIRLDQVTKSYPDGTVAVDGLSLEVARGELLALVGPSGSGKSTTLRMINRLIEPSAGRIWLDGRDVTHADPVQLRRGIGYVIQRVGLFPHRTVQQNVTTVPDLIGWPKDRARARARELLDLVDLDPAVYADRYPHELSGGQQQRVGVARALAADPPVLLMDEPFGAIDPIARGRLQRWFASVQADLHKTVVLVTHDIDEAIRLGDRVAVLATGGVLEQVADPLTLLAEPASERVAAMVGSGDGLRRMSVTPLGGEHLAQPRTSSAGEADGEVDGAAGADGGRVIVLDGEGRLHGWAGATVQLGIPLTEAFEAVTAAPDGWVPVLDGERYLGVLDAATIHASLRPQTP